MVMHVFAFAGVIASSIFNNVTKDLYYIDPQNEEASVLYNASIFIMAVMLVVTQVLLCAIFWQFGGKLEAPDTQETEEPEELLVKTYDDDSELQARIWNAFAMKRLQSNEVTGLIESSSATITAEQVKNPNRKRQSKNVNETLETEGLNYDEQQMIEE